MHPPTYRIYILANCSRCIYVGITRDLPRRLWEHRHGVGGGFTRRYGISRLVHVETFGDVLAAIAREKQLKRWPRWRKDRLIDMSNPTWDDLADAWPELAAPTDARVEQRREAASRQGRRSRHSPAARAPAG